MNIKGIDVSKHQGKIDWSKVKADGVKFAMIRAGYGNSISQKDTLFDYNVTNALANGIDVGAYWFSYAVSSTDARKEAQVFLQVIEKYRGKMKYPVCFDYEYDSVKYSISKGVTPTKSSMTSIAKTFMTEVKNTGWATMNYTNMDFIRNKFDMSQLSEFEIWLADYSGSPDVTCGIQQTSSNGKVNGISGSVDMDTAFKDYANHQTASDAVSDTTSDFSISKGNSYQFQITSSNTPSFILGTANVFTVSLVSQIGKEYLFRITAIGNSGQASGVFLDGKKICIVTVKEDIVVSDTPTTLNVSKGKTYQFKLTADKKPVFTCGNGGIFIVDFVKSEGNDHFFKVTAIGDIGQSAGFYANGKNICIGTIK